MCGARLFAVRVILLQRNKRFPARPPDLSLLAAPPLAPTALRASLDSAQQGGQAAERRLPTK